MIMPAVLHFVYFWNFKVPFYDQVKMGWLAVCGYFGKCLNISHKFFKIYIKSGFQVTWWKKFTNTIFYHGSYTFL